MKIESHSLTEIAIADELTNFYKTISVTIKLHGAPSPQWIHILIYCHESTTSAWYCLANTCTCECDKLDICCCKYCCSAYLPRLLSRKYRQTIAAPFSSLSEQENKNERANFPQRRNSTLTLCSGWHMDMPSTLCAFTTRYRKVDYIWIMPDENLSEFHVSLASISENILFFPNAFRNTWVGVGKNRRNDAQQRAIAHEQSLRFSFLNYDFIKW